MNLSCLHIFSRRPALLSFFALETVIAMEKGWGRGYPDLFRYTSRKHIYIRAKKPQNISLDGYKKSFNTVENR
jgi:hypothetical protein